MIRKVRVEVKTFNKGPDPRRASAVRNTEDIRLRYGAGAVITQDLLVGAVAVARGDAKAIDERGKVIPVTKVVVCRVLVQQAFGERPPRGLGMGAATKVVDPGSTHANYLLPGSMLPKPVTLMKTICLPVAICGDATEACGVCCNKPQHA